MRAISAASAALLGAAALCLTAPLAAAATVTGSAPGTPGVDSGAVLFTASPSTVAPGGRVALSASGCATTATASSGAFNGVTIRSGTSTVTTVRADARPGTQYSVQFTCGSRRGTFNLNIAGGLSTPTIAATAAVSSPAASPQGVRGGLGGSVGEMNAGEITIGAALVVTAAAATAFAVRRRTPADDRRH
ncbi:hypothetical protein [Streptomyces sp. CAU 1734]|uniref:hypothetical protein n=1 Tax=Streptomyces sp. CAU 1734 TaxID=3140360 RepID=UPI00325FE3B4